MTITLMKGESALLKAIEWARMAEGYRAQGNNLMADTYLAWSNKLLQLASSVK